MRKIIAGLRYDTATAEIIFEFQPLHDRGNFRWYRETLFRTARGAYFLHGEGGPRSVYRQEVGQNSWSGGQDITPLSDAEAFGWLCRIGEPVIAERLFPDMVEDA